LKTGKAKILRVVGEALLIVVSVYVAIVLEGISSARSQRASALESLRTVRSELESDLLDARALAEQKGERALVFSQLSGWLSSDDAIPVDSFAVALEGVLTGNYTIFPRRASWATMVSEGQLASVGDPGLVNRLADLYEHWNARVMYNGDAYDSAIWEVTRTTVPTIWDRRMRRFIRLDPAARRELDGQLVHLEIWNQSYGALLTAWADAMDTLIGDIDRHLEHRGGGA